MKTVTHKVWPVSYINDQGKQVDTLYLFNPKRADPSYWVDEPMTVVAQHIEGMDDSAKEEKIAALKAQIARLES